MTDKPPATRNIATAPMIYFDNVPTFGAMNGVVELDLAARVLVPQDNGGPKNELACVGHLRCSILSVALLRDVIDQALAMAEAQGGAIPGETFDERLARRKTLS